MQPPNTSPHPCGAAFKRFRDAGFNVGVCGGWSISLSREVSRWLWRMGQPRPKLGRMPSSRRGRWGC